MSPIHLHFTKVESIWNGEGDNLYKKMVNNFFAETVNFFLEDSELSFIASKTQKDPSFGNMESGKTYGMRVKVAKTYSTSRKVFENDRGKYFPPNNYISGNNFARENITMYSRPTAFGPPTNSSVFSNDNDDDTYMDRYGSSIGYNFPYTPPYYYGESWCDILFEANETTKIYINRDFTRF